MTTAERTKYMSNKFLESHLSADDMNAGVPEGEEVSMDNKINYDYSVAIEKELNDMPFMFKRRMLKDETLFELLMPSERLQALRIKMIVGKDGDVKFRCYLAEDVVESNIAALQNEINRLNARYRFICLSIDDDRDICAAYDDILYGDEKSAADHAIAMLVLFTEIIDKCVPNIMPLIWKELAQKDEPEKVKMNLFDSEGGVA